MKKRVLSLFMALALCLTPLPTAALAEEAGAVQDAANANSTYTTGEDAGLTGGSSGEMQDGAADAAAEAGTHTAHCVCGGNGEVNGHNHDTAGTEWKTTDSLPNSAGSYYLTKSVSGDWTVPTGEVNLCLNGQTINGKITVGSGAKLTLTDCSDSGRVQGEVTVNGGKFELYSGTITGGVQVGIKGGSYKTGSAFTMYGGTISGNSKEGGSGGGVFLVGTTNSSGLPPSFTMHGGTISDNTAGASDGGGGGVYVGEKCSFTMDGGVITGNTATNGNGGGIYIHMLSKVTISGGEITNNKAPATGDISHGHGGGIYSESGVTVKNVTITGNNSTFAGGGIYGKGAITLTDATVTGNNQYDVYYDGKESTTPELTVSGSVKAGYYANYDWKLPILVSGELSADSVIRVGVRDGIKPAYGSQLAIAEPKSGVTLSAKNFKADAADSVTSLGEGGKVYLVPCTHEMDETGYTCKKCGTKFDARVGENAYYQTLAEAFSAVRDSTVTLLRDVTLTGNCSAAYNSPATLDLNGKTVSSETYDIRVGGGNSPNTLTVKDSGTGGGTQALTVKFLVYSNGTLAVDDSYTGKISRVELQASGALERFGGKIGELALSNAAGGSTSTGYNLKLWNGNTNACTIGKFTDNNKSKSLTVNDLLKTNHAKCELYGEKDGTWSIVDKNTKIVDLTDYTAYKVQFQECVHQCDNDTVEKPVCSKCGKALVVKITATASDDKIKTAWFPVDSAIENGDGYVEAIQTLNGWSAEGYTDATLMPLCDVHNGTGGIGIASVTLTGKLAVDGGKHLIYATTIASDADVTFKTGKFYHITVNGKASFVGGTYLGGVTASSGAEAVFSGGAYQYLTVKDGGTAVVKNTAAFGEDVKVTKGTLTVEGGSFKAAVVVEGDGTMNVNGGSFTGTGYDKVTYSGGAKGTISGGSFADLYLYGSGTAWLAGGSFTKLSTASSDVLSSLLADGAAYYDQSGNAISGSGVSKLNNVTVKTHAHTVDEKTGICSVCGKQMAASLTAGNETSWYLTLDAAIAAANEGNGEKTLKLYQDVKTNVPSYELTHGSVTLDVNGKTASGVIITVKGIQLTVTGTGTIWGVTASGSNAVVKNSTVKINYITAENGGRLELGGGSYMGLTVKNDGSSASLSGGTYKKIEWGKLYVPANEYLADGYGYKTSDGKWDDGTASVDNVTVTPAPIKSTKVYPNSETGYSGSTFDAKDSTSVTLTVSVTSDESAGLTYIWCRSINDEWRWLTNSSITQNLTEKYTGADSQTLSITELPAGQTFSYKVQIATGDGYKCYSEPFTVTRHQHSWTYTASGATITAKCTAEDCYLTDKLGGTFTISAPAANTLTYDGSAKEATAKLDAVSGVTSLPTVDDITYMQNGKTLTSAPVNAGEYTASITVGDATANVEYTIAKAAPTASDFTFQAPAPSDLTYNGNPKTATVASTKNGMGAVTVKYYQDDKLVEKPTNAGVYTVKISVEEGTNYSAATDLSIGELTIKPAQLGEGENKADTICYSDTGVKTYTHTDFGFTAAGTFAAKGSVTEGTDLLVAGYPKFESKSVQVKLADNLTWDGSTEKKVVIPMTFTPDGGNYEPKEVTLTITLEDKATDTKTMTVTQADFVYGEGEVDPQVTGVEGTPTFTYTGREDTTHTESNTVPTNAGKYTVTAKIDTADTVYTASADFEITRKPLTQDMVKLDETVHTYNATSQTVTVTVTDGSNVLTDNHDYSVSGAQQIPAGTHTVVVTGLKNYTGEISKEWKITPATLTITDATVAAKTYDGTKTATVESVNFGGLVNSETLTKGDDYTATGEFEDANAGDNKNVTVTVTLKNQNYMLKDGNTFKKTGVTITQAETPAALTGLYGIKGQKLSTVTLPTGWTWAAPDTEMSEAGDKTFTAKYHDAQGNYKDKDNVSVTVAVKDKTDVSDKISFPAGETTYDPTKVMTYEEVTITGIEAGMNPKWTYTYILNTGNGKLNNDGKPIAAGSYGVTAIYEDSKNIGRATAVLLIKKITLTGEPSVVKITEDNKTLEDAKLAGSTGWPTGTIKWVDKETGTELSNFTVVVANKEYKWVFTPDDTANYETLTGTVKLYTKTTPVTPPGGSSGGGGGGGAAPAPTPAPVNPDVITVKEDTKDNTTSKPGAETDTTTITKTTVKTTTTATTKNEQGQDVSKTTASVSKDLGDKLLDQAVSNKSDTIEITVKSNETNNNGSAGGTGAADSVKSTEVELPKATVNAIAKDTNADLVIKTDNGEVVLDNKTLETIAGAAKGDTVTIVVGENTQLKETQKPAEKIVGKNGTLFDLAAKIGERLLHQFEGGKAHVTLPMPEKLKGKDVLVIYIDDNGLCKILNHSVEKIGAEDYIRFTTTHFSTFAVVDKDEAERPMKEQNAAHVKELMQSAKFKVTTTKTSKKSVKVQVAAKSSKTMISDIKSLGYTVKYQFYRSTKKTSGYKLLKTKTTSSFTNTKGKKGTKYYYKARVLVYDGKTLIAKSELKQASCGVRTWTK